jgi:hypothetical protein
MADLLCERLVASFASMPCYFLRRTRAALVPNGDNSNSVADVKKVRPVLATGLVVRGGFENPT